jgi:methyl-accepting chemotaxis protein
MNISIGSKIRLCVVLVFLIASISGLIAIFETNKMNEAVREAQILSSRVGVAGEVQYLTAMRLVTARGYLVYEDEKYLQEFDQFTAQTDELLQNLLEETRREENRILVHQLIDVNREYTHIINEKVVPAARGGDFARAADISARDALPVVERMLDMAEYYAEKRKNELTTVTAQTVAINQATQRHILYAIAGALLVGLLLTQRVIGGIIQSIQDLTRATRQVAEGDLTLGIDVKRSDELGALASSFDQMARQLRSLIRDIVTRADGLAAGCRELSFATSQASENVQVITNTTSRVADTAKEEANQVQQVLNAINNVNRYIDEAYETVARNTDVMRSIHRSVESNSAIIKELGKQSREISQINYLVESIAEKTNMLAVSASIEATRAGERGLGFGAVAEEIRKLAEQSSQSIHQFHTIIEDIQSCAARAVYSMEQGTGEAVLGVEIAGRVNMALGNMVGEIETAINLIREIARGIEETKYATRKLVDHAEETNAAIDEIAEATQDLDALAQEYRDLVGSFKVERREA